MTRGGAGTSSGRGRTSRHVVALAAVAGLVGAGFWAAQGAVPPASDPSSSPTAPAATAPRDPEPAVAIGVDHPCIARFSLGGNVDVAGCEAVDPAAADALRAAMLWLGTPYAWGGGDLYGPTHGTEAGSTVVGFDCSGLTRYAWASGGVLLPRNSRAQWDAPGIPLTSLDELEPGDLVFFARDPADPSTIFHVGLALGADAMLEAPEPGGVVRVLAGLSEDPLLAPLFVGGLRPTG